MVKSVCNFFRINLDDEMETFCSLQQQIKRNTIRALWHLKKQKVIPGFMRCAIQLDFISQSDITYSAKIETVI